MRLQNNAKKKASMSVEGPQKIKTISWLPQTSLFKNSCRTFPFLREAAWPSGLGRWCCNPEVPVQGLHPATS